MSHIRDMVYVSHVQKLIGRKLNEDELNGEWFRAITLEGGTEIFQVPILEFPRELIPNPEDYYVPEIGTLNDG